MTAQAVLALNLGSSTLKFALFDADAAGPARRWQGEKAWSGGDTDHLAQVMAAVLAEVDQRLGGQPLAAVGHRIVHGGAQFGGPVRIDEGVMAALDRLSDLAPLHQPFNLAGVRAVAAWRPGLAQTASFDTAFHATIPAVASRFALPRRFEAAGVRRYGFHGLSYTHLAERLAILDPHRAAGRVLAAHLGAGASLCAIRGGRSLDTTMGFSTIDGLVMATRCGTLDPGAVLHLLRSQTQGEVTHLLHKESGLLGLSGISGDMRRLLASGDPRAHDALDSYIYRAGREAAALAGALGGLDALVFTGGVGQNAPEIRARICERLAWLGVSLDPGLNDRGGEGRIDDGSGPAVWIIPADEEGVVARETVAALRQ